MVTYLPFSLEDYLLTQNPNYRISANGNEGVLINAERISIKNQIHSKLPCALNV